MAKKISLIDLAGIGNLLEYLVAVDNITCEERDRIILRIAQENNPDYSEDGYIELLEKKKAASFTLTPKLWIDRTKAIGIVFKQGKAGSTFAHPMIACEFASWIAPEFKMLLMKLSLERTRLK